MYASKILLENAKKIIKVNYADDDPSYKVVLEKS